MFKRCSKAVALFTIALALSLARAQGPGKSGPPLGGPLGIKRGSIPETGGIQWFATWESGKREAERSGRPIMLVSAAPHAGGVSGCW